MKKYIGYITTFYFGAILQIADITFTNWEFYVIVVPVIIGYHADKYFNPID